MKSTEAEFFNRLLTDFQIPTYDLSKIKWAYRATGPLRSLVRVSGGFGVLLAYRFFHTLLRWRLTPAFGINLLKDGESRELDFGCLMRPLEYGVVAPELMLAECKSFNDFQQADMRRLIEWGVQYPGSVLMFSTLRKELTPKEKRSFAQAINRCRRHWKDDRPRNYVLILTGNELFSSQPPQDSWRELGEKHSRLAAYIGQGPNLQSLCDATQQLYLDLEPVQTSWRQA